MTVAYSVIAKIKWFGTILAVMGSALSAFNFYPYNVVVAFVSTALWCLAGVLDDDKPLWTGEGFTLAIYIAGLFAFAMGYTLTLTH